MKKIILLCAGGISTGVFVKKIEKQATEENFEISISAHPMSQVKEVTVDADAVLLGPQVSYNFDNVEKECQCPVALIDMRAYGLMDAAKVIKQIREMVGE